MIKDNLLEKDDLKIENTEETNVENVAVEQNASSVDTVKKVESTENIENSESTANSNNVTFHKVENNNNSTTSSVFQTFGILAIIFLILLIVGFISFTVATNKNTTIISGTYISGYNVSKLSKDEALAQLSSYITSQIPEEITVNHNGYEASIPVKELGIKFDVSSAVNLAYQMGRSGNLLENDIVALKSLFSKTKIEPVLSLDIEQLKANLEDISSKLPDALIESSYYIEDSSLVLTKGKAGSVVDINKTADYIISRIQQLNIKDNSISLITNEVEPSELNIDDIHAELYKEPKDAYFTQNPYSVYPSENGIDFAISVDEVKNMLNEEKDEYVVPLKVLYPNVTTNMLGTEAFPNLLSTYSTKYSTSAVDRTTNLKLAASKINGTVLMPGETFSYNKVVGERTIAAGYKEAPIYVSGKVVDGVGGGICQITTTLYNAVVYANLEVVERTNHQFVPSYAPASRDATVVYGAIDFKFKNNRDYPIKLVCSVSNGIANFQIFGLKSDNDYQVEISNRVTSTTSSAIYSEAYKILKQNGQVVSSELLSRDVYKRH